MNGPGWSRQRTVFGLIGPALLEQKEPGPSSTCWVISSAEGIKREIFRNIKREIFDFLTKF